MVHLGHPPVNRSSETRVKIACVLFAAVYNKIKLPSKNTVILGSWSSNSLETVYNDTIQ